MYKEKYIKYKSKYLDLLNQLGGTPPAPAPAPGSAPPAPAPAPGSAPPAPAVTKKIFELRNINLESEFKSMTKDSISILDYFKDKIKEYDILDFYNCNTITDNRFDILIQALEKNSKPIELKVSSCDITDKSITNLGNALNNLNLIFLFLSGGNILYDFVPLINALKENTTLTTLKLGGVNEEGAKAIGEALKSNNTLTDLYLIGGFTLDGSGGIIKYGISDIGAIAIADALKTNTKLTTLKLEWVSDKGAREIANALKENTKLTTLKLDGVNEEGSKAIAEALKFNNTLTNLYLPCDFTRDGSGGIIKYRISDDGAIEIADALKTNTKLTTLKLEGVNDIGAIEIAKALTTNITLTDLYLTGGFTPDGNGGFINYIISDIGAKEIANALKTNTKSKLTTLKLKGVTDEGAKAIAEALKSNKKLTNLYLIGGFTAVKGGIIHYRISDIGAIEIADALKYNNTLQILDLTFNNITNAGAKKLFLASFDSNVIKLNLIGNTAINNTKIKTSKTITKDNGDILTIDLNPTYDK